MTVVRRQGIKNTVYAYSGILLGILSTLYIQPFFLTKEQIGLTRLIISTATILAIVSNLGSTTVIVKFFPKFYNPSKKHNGFFTVAILFPILGSLISFTLFSLFEKQIINFYGINSAVMSEYFWSIILMSFFICCGFSLTAYCNAINKSSLSTFIAEIINRLNFIICILLFAYSIVTQNQYIYLLLFTYVIQALLVFSVISYFDYPTFKISFFQKNEHIKSIIGYTLISSFIQITGNNIKFIDVIFVGKYESLQQVGVYSIAAFIGLVIETPLNAVEKIAGTKISKLFTQGNHSEIEKMYKLSSKYLMVFCGLLGSVMVVCIHPLLSLLPNDYSTGAAVTIIICIGSFFNSATGVNYSIITYSNYYKLGAIFYSSLLVITIILNMLLIPLYGIMGAAIATCSASIIHNLLRFIFIKIKLNMQPFSTQSLKIVFIIVASIFSAYWLQTENKYLLIVLRGIISAGVFTTLIILLKVFSIKEIKQEIKGFKNTFV